MNPSDRWPWGVCLPIILVLAALSWVILLSLASGIALVF